MLLLIQTFFHTFLLTQFPAKNKLHYPIAFFILLYFNRTPDTIQSLVFCCIFDSLEEYVKSVPPLSIPNNRCIQCCDVFLLHTKIIAKTLLILLCNSRNRIWSCEQKILFRNTKGWARGYGDSDTSVERSSDHPGAQSNFYGSTDFGYQSRICPIITFFPEW